MADLSWRAIHAAMRDKVSTCCDAETYVDEVDGGTYCTACDAEVDPKTGARLTEPERLRALCERELRAKGEA